MAKKEEKDFGFLGLDYQKKLLSQIITDKKFGRDIIDIIDPTYFSDANLRMICAEIKDSYDKIQVIPDINNIGIRLSSKNKNKIQKEFINAQLDEIKNISQNDWEMMQNLGMKFCQQQELRKSIGKMLDIIDNGELEEYDKCTDILKDALDVGISKDDSIDIFDDIESVLEEDFRKPIATGITGLDLKMNGGLSRTELAVVLAPFGVGKTTFMTKLANSAFNDGLNVLQVFFEDTPKIIQRKHLACWTGIEINDLGQPENRPVIDELIKSKSDSEGYLMLKKFPSDGTTIPMIRQFVRKLSSSGQKPDIILLDYIDCVAPATNNGESEWSSEGNIMRQFETMLTEFNMAGWTAIQGNRSSIAAETVDSSMLGGSIKKGQIAHFLLSIAKSLEQKETGRANMAILKSRFGTDGIIFDDILFDNARIQIDVDPASAQTEGQKKQSDALGSQASLNEMMDKLAGQKKEVANSKKENI